jgi:two-component system, cell cycle sensor histidine kinase and response regulator CckA
VKSLLAEALKVLVVDDDAQMLRTITDILRLRGYSSMIAGTGHEALDITRKMKEGPAVALVDLKLPDMDGIELIGRLREIAGLTEVVILTGNASVDSAVRALRENSNDYLLKPVKPEQLVGTIERAGERWQRRRAELGMRESQDRLRQIFDHVSDSLFIADASGTIIDANPAACALSGRPLESLRSLKMSEVLPENSLERGMDVTTGAQRRESDLFRRHDGKVLDVRSAAFAPGVLVYTVRDLTRQRELEDQLGQAQKMEAVGQLAGGVAHDFNNLLTVIMSYSSMLLSDAGTNQELRGDIQEISDAAGRAAALTRQLLAFSRKQVLQMRPVNVNAVVTDVEKMLRRLIGEDISLTTNLDADLAMINADPGQLEQVLINLAVNARDAMPGGGALTITTDNAELFEEHGERHLGASPGKYIMIAVTDTGTGMTKEVQQRLFEPFYTTKGVGKGTGLGLATVHGIVKQSGGDIYVYSELEHGTTFKVYFPRLTKVADVMATTSEHRMTTPRGSETILLAEDDESLRTLGARVLGALGYKVLVARTGKEALQIVADHTGAIDLIATDVVMPEMNGSQLVEKVLEARPGIRVLFMSGYTDDEVMRRGVINGQTAFLQKPFTPDLLAYKVREVLDGPALEYRVA